MKPTVTVLLPVFNAQDRLQRTVAEVLEVLPELADRFEILIVDDGSSDDTMEVARQLAREYPQVAAVRHPLRLGLGEAVQTGLDNTDGDVVFVGDEQYGLEAEDLRRLWPLRTERDLVVARTEAAEPLDAPSLVERLLHRQTPRRQAVAGIHMIRRGELDGLRKEIQADGNQHRLDRKHAEERRQVLGPLYLRQKTSRRVK